MGLTFNRLISSKVINALSGQVFNVHMSLLPTFPGFGSIGKAIRSGVRLTGVTLHLVDSGMDTGPILGQAACPVGATDDVIRLGRRLFEAGLPLVLQVVRGIERGELRLLQSRRPTWSRTDIAREVGHCFPSIDFDIQEFANDFCSKIPHL